MVVAFFNKTNPDRVEEMAQSVMCLSHEHKDLEFRSPVTTEKPSTVTCICNPRTGGMETGGSLEHTGQLV